MLNDLTDPEIESEREAGIKKYFPVPHITPSKIEHAVQYLKACLSIYYSKHQKKDNFDGRMRNAMVFLAEADRQDNNAISLSLCCTAMEAMLLRKGEPVVDKLSARTAALLEPDKRNRSDAIRFVSKRYDARSRVLHGSTYSQSSDEKLNARMLAAGIFKAILERNAAIRKHGGEPNPTEFFAELDDARENAGVILGPEESPVTSFWRT